MKQISGNKLLVKALKEEGVEYLFGYPGACTIDISDELYKQVVLKRPELQLVALFPHAGFDEVHIIRNLCRVVSCNNRRNENRHRNT